MRTIASAPDNIDLLGIGNSLIVAGFDISTVERVFQDSGRRCIAVNGGLGSTGVIEHFDLTRFAFRHHAVKTLIYGFFDQQMSSDVADKNSDLIGNRSILYYLEPELTLEYAHFDTLNRLSFQMYRTSALLRERGTIWARVEKLRRAMGSVGMPLRQTNQFGRRADFALLEAAESRDFVLACQKVIQSNGFLSAPVRALLQQARERSVKVIVVEMPMHPSHLKKFYEEPIWEEFRVKTRLAVEREGATYLNASAWMPGSELFEDHLHLSREGAGRFSRILVEHMLGQLN